MVEERIVGETKTGETVFHGPTPGNPRQGYYYTKGEGPVTGRRIQYEADIKNVVFNTDEDEVPHCNACQQDGHETGNCHMRGGTHRG